MITNISKKVICVKDIPSNIIEEAIFILKNDISPEKNSKLKAYRKEIATSEAETFLNDYLIEIERDESYENKRKNLIKKIIEISLVTVSVIIICYLLTYAVIN